MEKSTESKGINELVVGTQVLVVEDDEGLNKLIQKSLRRAGFDCFGVLSGADAIERVKKNPNQVFLIDQQLPDMDGTDLVRKLSKHTHDIIFVAMTGHGDEKIAVEMMKLGARDYLIKGFDLTDILPMVFKRVFSELETEKKLVRAEEALRETNAKHFSMIENIGDVIAIVGADGLTKYQSPNIEKWFGWKPEDIIGTNGWDKMHPEDIERIQKEFGEMLKKETASIVEFRFKCKDGNYKWIEMTALNSINDPAINGMLFNYHDITERKQAEESLKESEEKYRSIFESFQDIYYRANNRGIITELSPSVLQISGYKPDELIGKPVAVVYQDSANRLNLLQALKESGRVADYELKLLTKDKKVKIGSICSHVIIGQDGEINGIEGVIRDITERKQAEQELKISRERLKTANSILRHDITNDLTVIKSAVDIYRDERDETMIDEIEKRVKKSIETIHNQKDQMAFLDTHADLDEYDVKQVVQDVIKNYPDLEFKITGSGNAYADNALYSVFDNIISNAVRHGKTTQLDIDIIPGKEHCEIRFKDYGTGVPDEIKDKIFDEGYHYGKTGHTGIGLYIVQQTVEEYGGEVTVEDNKPHGAIFIIRMNKTIEGF